MNEQTYSFKALQVSQPVGNFFISKIPYDVITACARADIRRIRNIETEEMLGIQRALNKRRVNEIYEYVKTIDASFPNSVILNLNSDYCRKVVKINGSEEYFDITIEMNEETFSIIDGQHRMAGLEKIQSDDNIGKFEVIVSIFYEFPTEDQAYLFSTINSKQVSVKKSLVFDLFGLSKKRSPDLCAHLITKSLNGFENSPLYRRIALLGVAPRFKGEILYKPILTQGSVASQISRLISKNSEKDRDTLLRKEKLIESESYLDENLIFRNYYINNEDDVILKILLNFFNSVKVTFSNEWEDRDSPMSKLIGFTALMKFLVVIYKIGYKQDDLSYEYFSNIMKIVRNGYENDKKNLDFYQYQASGIGIKALYEDLIKWSKIDI